MFVYSCWQAKTMRKCCRVDGNIFKKREKKFSFSNENGYVWTGPFIKPVEQKQITTCGYVHRFSISSLATSAFPVVTFVSSWTSWLFECLVCLILCTQQQIQRLWLLWMQDSNDTILTECLKKFCIIVSEMTSFAFLSQGGILVGATLSCLRLYLLFTYGCLL